MNLNCLHTEEKPRPSKALSEAELSNPTPTDVLSPQHPFIGSGRSAEHTNSELPTQQVSKQDASEEAGVMELASDFKYLPVPDIAATVEYGYYGEEQ